MVAGRKVVERDCSWNVEWRLHERRGYGRVETDGLLLNDSLEIDKPFASHRRDACAPLMQCNADSIGRDACAPWLSRQPCASAGEWLEGFILPIADDVSPGIGGPQIK